jgi:hypothetical protein
MTKENPNHCAAANAVHFKMMGGITRIGRLMTSVYRMPNPRPFFIEFKRRASTWVTAAPKTTPSERPIR